MLRVAFDPYPMAPVTVRYGDQTWVLTAKDLGVNFDARSAAEAAYLVGRQPIAARTSPLQLAQLQANLQDQLAAYRFGHEVLAGGGGPLGRVGLAGGQGAGDQPAHVRSHAAHRRPAGQLDTQPGGLFAGRDRQARGVLRGAAGQQGATVDLQVKENKPLLADVSQAEVFVRQVLGGPVTLAAAEPDLDTDAPPPSYTIPAEELAKLVSTEMAPQLDGSFRW